MLISINNLARQKFVSKQTYDFTVAFESGLEVDLRLVCGLFDRELPLFVHLNGAVDRTRSALPIFQRSSWADELGYHSLFICDPTLRFSEVAGLGWGIGCVEQHGIQAMLQCVDAIRAGLNAAEALIGDKTLYFGSSAGGFQSILLATKDRNSAALAINPQIRITDFFERAVENALWAGLGTASVEEALEKYPERLDALAMMSSEQRTPECYVLMNTSSRQDMFRDFNHLTAWVKGSPEFENPFEIWLYSDSKLGHNPPAREETLRYIRKFVNAASA